MTVQVAPPVPLVTLDVHRLACKRAGQVVLQASSCPAWDGIAQKERRQLSLSEGMTEMGTP